MCDLVSVSIIKTAYNSHCPFEVFLLSSKRVLFCKLALFSELVWFNKLAMFSKFLLFHSKAQQ